MRIFIGIPLAAKIGAALQAMAAFPPFRLRLGGFGKFPAGPIYSILKEIPLVQP